MFKTKEYIQTRMTMFITTNCYQSIQNEQKRTTKNINQQLKLNEYHET